MQTRELFRYRVAKGLEFVKRIPRESHGYRNSSLLSVSLNIKDKTSLYTLHRAGDTKEKKRNGPRTRLLERFQPFQKKQYFFSQNGKSNWDRKPVSTTLIFSLTNDVKAIRLYFTIDYIITTNARISYNKYTHLTRYSITISESQL